MMAGREDEGGWYRNPRTGRIMEECRNPRTGRIREESAGTPG